MFNNDRLELTRFPLPQESGDKSHHSVGKFNILPTCTQVFKMVD